MSCWIFASKQGYLRAATDTALTKTCVGLDCARFAKSVPDGSGLNSEAIALICPEYIANN